MKLFLCLLMLLFSFGAFSNESPAKLADDCEKSIMQIKGEDFQTLRPNDVIDTCNKMPISEDLAVQTIAILVGDPFVHVLDAFTAISGEQHGLEPNSNLLTIASPLHSILEAFNWFMLSLFIFVSALSTVTQVLTWQKSDFKVDFKQWLNVHAPSKAMTLFLSTPLIGWLTPLQFIALGIIVGVVFISKFVIAYLFLASFLGETFSVTKDIVEQDLKIEMGKAVALQKCDIEQREKFINAIQTYNGSGSEILLKQSSLYQCLTTPKRMDVVIKELGSDSLTVRYSATPSNIANTQYCIDKHKSVMMDLGLEDETVCGNIQITIPNNTAVNNAISNVESLYLNNNIESLQRDVALSMHELECRDKRNFLGKVGTYPTKCFVASQASDAYQYSFTGDSTSTSSVLSTYNIPISGKSEDLFFSDMKKQFVAIQSAISNNTSAMLAHINDLLKPYPSESELPDSVQKQIADTRRKLASEYSETGTLGVHESDVEYLVSNIKKGPWASGSLFFGKLAYGVEKQMLADAVGSVYSVPEVDSGTFLNNLSVNMTLLALNEVATGKDAVDTAVDEVSSYLMPRVGLYTDSLTCWHDQASCSTQALNPFTYLGKKGVVILEQSLALYTASSLIHSSSKSLYGPQSKSGFMLAETLSEFYLVYIFIALILVFLIPAMPLIKIMVMFINWGYDVIRELVGIQITLCVSAAGRQGEKMLGDDVRSALSRLVGLGLYFLFVVMGIIAMFLMFSFLFGLNVYIVGALSYIIDWTGSSNSIESMVMITIFDVIITVILFYEIKFCTPYIEKFPMALADNFGIRVSNSSGVMDQAIQRMKGVLSSNVSDMLNAIKK